jgi:hypothetical protein
LTFALAALNTARISALCLPVSSSGLESLAAFLQISLRAAHYAPLQREWEMAAAGA